MDRHAANEAISLAIFVVSYVLIAVPRLGRFRLNRAGAALLGAVVMVPGTDVTFEAACRELLNWDTIALLIGFWEYCCVGIPVTAATTAVGVLVLWIYHALGV